MTEPVLLILLSLADQPRHGYAILKEVEQLTSGAVRLSTGTLYGIIKRLLADGLIREAALSPKDDERRRSYELTPFLQFAKSHIAVNHLSRPIGESSNMVPTLSENFRRGCFV